MYDTKFTHTAGLISTTFLLLEGSMSWRVVHCRPGHVAAVRDQWGLRWRTGGGVPGVPNVSVEVGALRGALVGNMHVAADHAVWLSWETLWGK